MRIGLFFGSFNPIHIGHLAIANYFTEFTDLDEVWLVVSPLNPFKTHQDMLPSIKRFSLVEQALTGSPKIKASAVELELPQPSYTINTLKVLEERHPGYHFVILMGSDGLTAFSDWKDSEYIAAHYQRFIYPRLGAAVEMNDSANILFINAPRIELSSTFIRDAIRAGKDVRYLVPAHLWEKIRDYYGPDSE